MRCRHATLSLALLAACGSAGVDPATPVQEPGLNAPEGAEPSATETDQVAATGGTRAAPPGAIQRRDLQRILAAGPAGVLAMVHTAPAREQGRFIGFRITAFVKGNPEAIDLRPGDVLVAINGKKIVSPDDYFRIFQELAVASELRFDVVRNGRPETLS